MAICGDFYRVYANDIHYHFKGPPGGGGYHGAADSRKTASFHFS